MKNIILIAVDLSEPSEEIIEQGLSLAKKLNSKVALVTIVSMYNDYIQPEMETDPVLWQKMYEGQQGFAHAALEKIKKAHEGFDIEIFAKVGNPKTDIIELSGTLYAAYIIIGTHGRTGLSHIVMGSTAEYIIRHSTIPVLVIPFQRRDH